MRGHAKQYRRMRREVKRLKAGQPGGNLWVEQLLKRRHINDVAVALANKMARTAWQETYRAIRAA